MSSGHVGKTTNKEQHVAAVSTQREREDLQGSIPGKIVSFDAAKQTATIQPLYKPRHNGKPVDMPELLEVPVHFNRGGNGALTFPVEKGDLVKLQPGMRNMEKYHLNGGSFEAGDVRSHSLSDMEAHLDGGESAKNPIPNFDGTNAHFRFDPQGNYGIRGNKDGKIQIQGSKGDIYKLLTDVVELLSQDTLAIAYGSSAGSGHALQHQGQYAAIAEKLRAMQIG